MNRCNWIGSGAGRETGGTAGSTAWGVLLPVVRDTRRARVLLEASATCTAE
jgi:hypothetical protein